MKPESIRLHAPSSVVFLCGGVTNASHESPMTLRDAFLRVVQAGALPKYEIVLAEKANPIVTDAGYSDLLRFESDIAQVVGLVLLFAESPGSLAELGAFAALRTISSNLMAIVEDFYYHQSSFIRNGPIKFLEHNHGDESVLVLDRKHIGIGLAGEIDKLDIKAFSQALLPEVEKRLSIRHYWTKFDPKNDGHAILLITGLCQEYGALTISEIKNYVSRLGVSNIRLSNFIYCAELLGWLQKEKKGNHSYYVAARGDDALDYRTKEGGVTSNALRWRSQIRAFWQDKERTRLRAIADVRARIGSSA